MLRNLTFIALLTLVTACSSSKEPTNSIGGGRDERALSPCACLQMETLGNQDLETYKLYLQEQLG